MNRHATRGFTLIELLIVVVIIGILAAIAIPKFSAVREKAFLSAMKSDLKNLSSQQEVYHNVHYAFASALGDAEALQSEGVTITINEADGTGWAATATHLGMPTEQCGIYHGDATAANGSPATQPGVVTCSL